MTGANNFYNNNIKNKSVIYDYQKPVLQKTESSHLLTQYNN